MEKIIIGLATLFFIGHVLKWFFVKTKIPDILILIILGFIIGPSGLNIIHQEHLGKVGAVLATVTLIIILYEGGLHLNARALARSSFPALMLSILSFCLILGVTTLVLSFFFSISTAVLIGLGIGSTSSAIVFPLIQPLDIKEKTKTILSLESAFTDVFSIIAFLAILESIVSKNYNTSSLFFGLGAKPFLSIGLGISSALLWSFFRKLFIQFFNMPFSGEAWSLLTYGMIELFNLNGPIGILAFGFTLANLNLIPAYLGSIFNLTPVTETEMSLLKAISSLLRTLFFIYLGVMMQLASPVILLWALLLTILIFITRYFSVRAVFSSKDIPLFDALISFGMGPRGLACAVLATLPLQKRIVDGQFIQSVIFYVILLSILFTSVFVIFGNNKFFKRMFSGLFEQYSDESEPLLESESPF